MKQADLAALPDGALIEAVRRGRREAFDALVARYQATLRVQAARYLVSADDVLDVVQDAFFNAYRHIDRFESGRPLLPWLRQIVRNRVLNLLRDRAVERARPLALVDAAVAEAAAAEQADGGGGELAAMRSCLAELSGQARELIERRYVRGMAIKTIAQDDGRSPGSVSMLLLRIRSALSVCVQRRLLQREAL